MEKIEKKPVQEIMITEIERWVKKTKENPGAINTLCLLVTVLCDILGKIIIEKIIIVPEEDLLKVTNKLKMIQSLPECAILLKNWQDKNLPDPIQRTIENLEKSIPDVLIEPEKK